MYPQALYVAPRTSYGSWLLLGTPGYDQAMERLTATVTVEDLPGGSKITIEYSDGHTVYLSASPDSIVLRKHLGLDDARDGS